MKSAVAFSGGYDSTYVLWKLLTLTDEEVTAISFVRAPGATKPWFAQPAELTTHIPKIIDELQKIRPFTHIVRVVSDEDITEENNEATVFFVSEYVADINNGTYDNLVSGRSWEQYNEYRIKGVLGTLTDMVAQRIFDRDATRGKLWYPLVTRDFHYHYCRWHTFTYLPENLQALCVSCCDPVNVDGNIVHCGQCHKCLWDEKVRWMIAQGWNADQVNAWKHLKGLQYGGGNGLSAPTRFWVPVEMGRGKITYGMDTAEKIKEQVQRVRHYSIAHRPNEGVWKF